MSLTEKQKEVLRWLVEQVRAGKLDEEQVWFHWNSSDGQYELLMYKGSSPHVKSSTLNHLGKIGYLSWDIEKPSDYRGTLTGKAYEAVDSDFAEPARSANYHLNSPIEITDLDPLKVWQEKLNYFQYQEVIAADPEVKFSLKKKIEECQRKISELSSITDR